MKNKHIIILYLFIAFNSCVSLQGQQNYFLISNFEDNTNDIFTAMGNIAIQVVENQQKSGENTSDYVLRISGTAGNADWHGMYSGAFEKITVGNGTGQYRYAHFKVYKSFVSQMLITLKQGTTEYYPEEIANTTTNAWEYVVVDLLTGQWGPQAGQDFSRLNFAMNRNTSGAEYVSYIDDILFSDSATPVCYPESSTSSSAYDTWELVFQDDFNGTAINQSQWYMYNGSGHGGNGLRRPSAFSVADGILTITAQMVNGQIVSGGMGYLCNQTYGKFEARVRADDDPSLSTSAVLLTWPKSESWPIDGENDFYETTTNRRDKFHTYIHYGADNKQYHKEHLFDAKQWLVVAMEWEADWIKIYVNGELQWTLTDKNAIPHVPHHLCIQLDAFKTTMTGSTRMQVDWVKIYQRTPIVSSKSNILDNQKPVHVSRLINGQAVAHFSENLNSRLKIEIYNTVGSLLSVLYDGDSIPNSYEIPNFGNGIHILKAYTDKGIYNIKF